MTGVQTCALPICFPVTIFLANRRSIFPDRNRVVTVVNCCRKFFCSPFVDAPESSLSFVELVHYCTDALPPLNGEYDYNRFENRLRVKHARFYSERWSAGYFVCPAALNSHCSMICTIHRVRHSERFTCPMICNDMRGMLSVIGNRKRSFVDYDSGHSGYVDVPLPSTVPKRVVFDVVPAK